MTMNAASGTHGDAQKAGVTFRENAGRNDRLIGTIVLVAGTTFIAIFAFAYWEYGEFGLNAATVIFLAIPCALFLPNLFGHGHRIPRTITLDGTGLTYSNYLTRRHWSWHELSAAEFRSPDPQTDPHVRIRVPSLDWKARWTLMESLSGSEIRLRDTYDVPLNDIHQAFNECRERALAVAGVGACGASQAQQT